MTALDPKGRPMPTARVMMRPPMSLMAQVAPEALDVVVSASQIAPRYATDTDPESAKELLAARLERAAEEPMDEVAGPVAGETDRMRPTSAPEKGVDWTEVAQEGARFARSGAFNTILRTVLGVLGGRRR